MGYWRCRNRESQKLACARFNHKQEPRLDMDAAVNKQIFKEDIERRTEKEKQRESKGKMKKGGKGKRDKSHFANKGGKGKFTGKSKGKNRGLGQSKAQKKKANPSRGK